MKENGRFGFERSTPSEDFQAELGSLAVADGIELPRGVRWTQMNRRFARRTKAAS